MCRKIHPFLSRPQHPRAVGYWVSRHPCDRTHPIRNVPEPYAEAIARAVFAAVRRRLPQKEGQDVASQLPRDLKVLWMFSTISLMPEWRPRLMPVGAP